MGAKIIELENRSEQEEADFAVTLKSRRKDKGLTLDSLAKASGVSKSTLSRIENRQLSPTYDVICKIARGLELSVEALFAEPSKGVFRGWRSVTRVADRNTNHTPHYDLALLCSDVADRSLLIFAATITARSLEEFPELLGHDGEEQLIVLSGTVQVHTEFYEPMSLSIGDSVAFDSRMGHAVISVSKEDANVLWVTDGHRPNIN